MLAGASGGLRGKPPPHPTEIRRMVTPDGHESSSWGTQASREGELPARHANVAEADRVSRLLANSRFLEIATAPNAKAIRVMNGCRGRSERSVELDRFPRKLGCSVTPQLSPGQSPSVVRHVKEPEEDLRQRAPCYACNAGTRHDSLGRPRVAGPIGNVMTGAAGP